MTDEIVSPSRSVRRLSASRSSGPSRTDSDRRSGRADLRTTASTAEHLVNVVAVIGLLGELGDQLVGDRHAARSLAVAERVFGAGTVGGDSNDQGLARTTTLVDRYVMAA